MKPGPKPKAPRKKREPVEDRLLATAGRCFLEDGFGFGIDDILAQSNVAKMSLYVKFQSKYGLIERLLEDAAVEWRKEIERVTVNDSLQGAEKVVELLRSVCGLSRDLERRTGLIGQALLEFPRTRKADPTHEKKDLVHKCALRLQSQLVQAVEDLCRTSGVDNPTVAAQQFVLLANGYLITEILLGKAAALKLTTQTAQSLLHAGVSSAGPAPVTPRARKSPTSTEPKQTPSPEKEKIRRVGPSKEQAERMREISHE